MRGLLVIALAAAAALAGELAPAARAQSGGGDVFSTTTAQPAGSGAPVAAPDEEQDGLSGIDRYGRDPECGGTNRAYYDKMFGTSAVVVSPEEAQRLSNRGEVIQCGGCPPDKEICWLKRGGGADGTTGPAPVKLYGGVQENVVPTPPPGQNLTGGVGYGPPQMAGRKKGACWVRVHGFAEPVYVWVENRHVAGEVVQGSIQGSRSFVWAQGTVLRGDRFRCTAVRDAAGRLFAIDALTNLTPE